MTEYLLAPDAVHVFDELWLPWEDAPEARQHAGERVVAYGFFTDDLQSVLTMLSPHARRVGRVWDDRYESVSERAQNYATFFLDGDGRRSGIEYHCNVVYAVRRYAEEMGMDV